ncbi:hypothetical protein F7P83_02990 [Brevibacterium luteolum]|nr:hypothetical protein [Brevibacterium luteolum]
MTPIRLFHFDIPTWGNYGDKALFPVVRDLFTGFAGGQAFEFAGAAPLRREVGFELVERINVTADAVVVGGGGLCLQDTNPNANSGWQWNISRAALDRLEVPIIVFAVGDNRFPGQPAFSDLFVDHVSAVAEKSVFFGLRNHGSMASMAETLPDAAAAKIEFQPCPSALGRLIYGGPRPRPQGSGGWWCRCSSSTGSGPPATTPRRSTGRSSPRSGSLRQTAGRSSARRSIPMTGRSHVP